MLDSVGFFFSVKNKVSNYINYYKAQILSTERIDIYGSKATIKQYKFGVWQFRMWVSNVKRYYEKSLRTKSRTEAIDKAEEIYFDLQNELKDGRKLFSVSIADAVAIYLEHRKIDVRTKEIVEGLWVTIRTHLNHFIEYVGENEKAAIARKLDVKKIRLNPKSLIRKTQL